MTEGGKTYTYACHDSGVYNSIDSSMALTIACPPGYQVHAYDNYLVNRGNRFCYQCDTGTYSDIFNPTFEDCKRCPQGTTTRGPGAKSLSDCYRSSIIGANAGPQAGGETPQVTLSSLALVRHSSGGLPAAHASAAAFLVLAAALAATARCEEAAAY